MRPRPRRNTARDIAVALAAAILIHITPPLTAPPTAQAAGFNAGMIISDGVFYNAGSMDSAQIQAFLNAKGAACVAGQAPCLKNFRQSTWTRPADTRCTGTYIGAQNESAATIIFKVATACQVNPQVLLVLLQKEQSLVTASGSYLLPRRYEAATGYGCPDTAPCNAEYVGFYNQVYKAAWAFRNYRLNPYSYNHVAGRTNSVRYHPTSSCGTVNIYIENQATAGLYNYTPYTPNTALLSGRPNACSSYGNHNFSTYFTSWFGSTQFSAFGAIGAFWQANAAALGQPTGAERAGLRSGGAVQSFERGAVYWTPSLGAHMVRGSVLTYFGSLRWEQGPLGYPLTNDLTLRAGSTQAFEGGTIYWSPASGAHVVLGAVQGRWLSMGGVDGLLGYPTTDERSLGRGTVQSFTGGHVYWTPAYGAHAVRGGVYAWWAARSWERGAGYPTTGERPGLRGGGVVQSFEWGSVYWTPFTGAHGVPATILPTWATQGWENGRLGYPIGEAWVSGGRVAQSFEGGVVSVDLATGRGTVAWR